MAVYKWNRYSIKTTESTRSVTLGSPGGETSKDWGTYYYSVVKPSIVGRYYAATYVKDSVPTMMDKDVSGKYITKTSQNVQKIYYGLLDAKINYYSVPSYLDGNFTEYTLTDSKGTLQGASYSNSSSAYPNPGVSGGYWYEYVGVLGGVAGLSVPGIAMDGGDIPVSWNAFTDAQSYILERRADSGSWTQVYSGTETGYTDTAGDWSTVQYRVKVLLPGGVSGEFTTSAEIPVVSASALVISGTDGDLGELSADVAYTCSSSGDGAITVTETVNGVYERTFTAVNGAANKISVLDLPAGGGTIHLTASTNPGSGVVTVTREWRYTKTAPAFADSGVVARLEKDGKNHWPMTIPEAVRAPRLFGGDLGKALEKLAPFVPGGAVLETGSYTGTGTYDSTAKNKLVFRNRIALVFIVRLNHPSGLLTPFLAGGTQAVAIVGGTSAGNVTVFYEVNGNEVSWYAYGQALNQLNASGETYFYAALTIPGGEA